MNNFNSNRGYVGQSMSVRAVEAYESGELPISKVTKGACVACLKRTLEAGKIDDKTFDKLKKVSLQAFKDVIELEYESSYHHTGKYFQVTYFYQIPSVWSDADISYLLAFKKPVFVLDYSYCALTKNVWGGTKKHPKVIGEDTIIGIECDGWCYYSWGDHKVKVGGTNVTNVYYGNTLTDLRKATKKSDIEIGNVAAECRAIIKQLKARAK